MSRSDDPLGVFLAGTLRLWIVATSVMAVFILALWMGVGSKGFDSLSQTGPYSIKALTLASAALIWISWGAGLILLKKWRFEPVRLLAVLGSLFILVLYVNILREGVHYGDVGAYIGGASDLREGRPFHGRYLSPPLLATLCQPLLWLGAEGLAGAFWLAHLVSLVAFFWLLQATLSRYGFGRMLSLAASFAFIILNVPVLRTLVYAQINLLVLDLILLAVLLFPRHRGLSAFSLAAAASLKLSPLVLAAPFVWTRDRRWIVSFAASLVALSGMTALFHGWAPFVDSFRNLRDIHAVTGVNFRDNSVDSLVRSTASLWGKDVRPFALFLLKVPVLALIAAAAVSNGRRSTFVNGGSAGARILNVMPAMLILMLLASPLVWEHHAVFAALPFLVIAKVLDSPRDWMWYGAAYALEFLTPTFDFFPLSFGRLASPLILTCLLLKNSGRKETAWFVAMRDRMESVYSRHNLRSAAPAGK